MMALAFLAHREKENTEVPSLHQLALAWALLGLVATAGINPRGSLLLRRDRCVVVVHTVSAPSGVENVLHPSYPCSPHRARVTPSWHNAHRPAVALNGGD